MQTRNLDLEGPAGPLEAVLMTPAGEPKGAALLCHAHPLHGGTMHFKLLFRAAKLFQTLGYAALRFQFRGVGRSVGEFDRGRGEADDARAALDFLAREYKEKAVVLGGFSFGAAIALPVGARDDRVTALVLMGLPVLAIESTPENPRSKPVLFIQGEQDEFGGRRAIEDFVRTFPGPAELAVIRGSDHL
ncbi:MAG: alpha/beta hydrolase, partial [Vicinamibacteria bacterium]